MSPSHHGEEPDRDAGPVAGQGADPLDVALDTLRRRRFDPPSDMVDRAVLRAVRARAEAVERERTSWRRFAKPVALLGLLTLSAVGALLLVQRASHPAALSELTTAAPPPVPEEGLVAETDAVPVRFVLPAAGAREVAVAGEFNGWDASLTPLNDDDGDGVFHTTLSLSRGAYAYMFVVDGERWVTDPFADAYRDDGFGNRNAVVRIP